jgi:hypothetical protein
MSLTHRMLTLLRNITRRPSAAVCKPLAAKYSTDETNWGTISNVLEQVSEEQQAPPPSSTNFAGSTGGEFHLHNADQVRTTPFM